MYRQLLRAVNQSMMWLLMDFGCSTLVAASLYQPSPCTAFKSDRMAIGAAQATIRQQFRVCCTGYKGYKHNTQYMLCARIQGFYTSRVHSRSRVHSSPTLPHTQESAGVTEPSQLQTLYEQGRVIGIILVCILCTPHWVKFIVIRGCECPPATVTYIARTVQSPRCQNPLTCAGREAADYIRTCIVQGKTGEGDRIGMVMPTCYTHHSTPHNTRFSSHPPGVELQPHHMGAVLETPAAALSEARPDDPDACYKA